MDVGANVGLLTLQIKEQRPKVECHLFEADENVFAQLKNNFEINGFTPSAIFNQTVVTDKSEDGLLFYKSHSSTESGWGRLENKENFRNPSPVKVRGIALDDYLAEKNINTVDLLKIDVEGAEEKVLNGTQKSLKANKIKAIICELNEEALKAFGTNSQNIRSYLKSFGYQESKQMELNSLFLR